MYQKRSATEANKPSEAATYWLVLYWWMMLLVEYSTLTDANSTMAPENHMPKSRFTPGMNERTMSPIITKPPIFRNPPRKEKSFFVVNATTVMPATSAPVIKPALAMSA